MTIDPSLPICPLVVAEKLRAIRQLEFPALAEEIEARPRLVEMLWFIQWKAHQPGGLPKFARELVEEMPEWFATDAMHAVRTKNGNDLTTADKEAAWQAWPPEAKSTLLRKVVSYEISEKATACIDYDLNEYDRRLQEAQQGELLASALAKVTLTHFAEGCTEAAKVELPRYLAALCVMKEKPLNGQWFGLSYGDSLSAWFTHNLTGLLFAFMDKHAERECNRLVRTEVFKRCADAFEYALFAKDMVTLEGDPRFGKTVSFDALCRARPGRMRKVTMPPGDTVSDLYKAIADGFLLSVKWDKRLASLREPVEFLLQHSGLGLACDECHFLIPERVTKSTRPERLNRFRASVVDQHVPCVISFTPQYQASIDHMAKLTGYKIEQWLGRPAMEYQLPEAVSDADMMALARHYLGNINTGLLKKIVGRSTGSHTYLKGIQNVATRARFLSDRQGVEQTEALVESAMNDVLPSAMRQLPAAAQLPSPAPAPAALRIAAAPLLPPLSGNAADPRQQRGTTPAEATAIAESAPRFSTEQIVATAPG